MDCDSNNYYWYYVKTTNKYTCTNKCPSDYLDVPLAETSILCLEKSCKGTHYPYIYNNKCYTSCANSNLLEILNGFEVPESPNSKANYTCKCLNPWYRNTTNNTVICSFSKYPFSIFDCDNFTTTKFKI